MTREENNLFCRIAIHNKLVNLEEANLCLREALTAGKDVSDVFVAQGLLTVEQAMKVTKAVAKVQTGTGAGAGAGAGARPARASRRASRESTPEPARTSARRSAAEAAPGWKKGQRKTFTQAQVGLTVGSLVILLAAGGIFFYLWIKESEPPPKEPDKKPAALTTLPDGGAPDLNGLGGAGGSKAPSTPTLSKEEKDAVDEAFNSAMSDARLSMSDRTAAGVAALDGALKKHEGSATPEQIAQAKELRGKLMDSIKSRYAKHKEELIKAKKEGNQEEINTLLDDIRYYADPDTIKEAEGIAAGG